MGIFEKGATTDINSAIQKIMNKAAQNNWDTVAATLAAPVDALRTELGPLTGKAGKDSTVDAAVMLACVTAQSDQSFLTTVSQIATSLTSSGLMGSNGSVDSAMSLTFNIENFRGVVTENVTAVKGSIVTTAPVLVQLLDVIMIQSVSAVPYVGPVLSGLLGGLGTGLAAAFTVGGNAIASQFTPPSTDNKANPITGIQSNTQGMAYTTATNMNKGLSGVVSKNATLDMGGSISKAGAKASGPASFIYYLYKGKSAKDESARLEQLRGLGDDVAILNSISGTIVQNPLDQHQLANNVRAQQSRFGGNIPQMVQNAGKNLKDKLQTEEDSLTAFFNKIPDVFDSYKKFVLQVANASVIESFAPMIQAFDARLGEMQLKLGDPMLGPAWLRTPQHRNAHVVALLVLGYYFNRLIKSSEPLRKTYRRHIPVYYRSMPMPSTGVSNPTFMLPQDSSVVIPQGQGVAPRVSAFSGVSQNETSTAIISAFNDTKTLPQLSLTASAVEWAQIGEKAKTYVMLVKNALVNEMAQGFSQSLNNRAGLSEMVKLYLAATLIVNQVMVQTSAKKAIEIDDRYVSSISDLGFVNLYRKIGSYDDTDKLKLTGSGPNAKLRYPMASRFSRSASTAERTMMYLFACCVLAYVDIGRVVMGYQDWKKTKERLHLLIDEINNSEKD